MRACSPRSIPPSAPITLPSRRRVLLSDTVGFVRNLPTTLIEAFRATLEEVADAALILHVVDVSSDQAAQHVAEVFRVLGEIGAAGTPQILVLNKADRLACRKSAMRADARRATAGRRRTEPVDAGRDGQRSYRRRPRATFRSRSTKWFPSMRVETVQFRIPLRDGAAIALLHRCGRVRAEDYDGNLCVMEVDAPESLRRRLRRYLDREFHSVCGKFCAQVTFGSPQTIVLQVFHVFEPERSNSRKRLSAKG